MPQSFMFISRHDAPTQSRLVTRQPALVHCADSSEVYQTHRVSMNAALGSYSPGLHSCIMTT